MKKLLTLFLLLYFSSISAEESKKVALLFLTRSDLNQNEIWREWIDPQKYNVYNHSKFPCSDPWFSQFRIPDIQHNEWGFLLYAQRALFKEALKNPENYKFVLLSESCIPIRPSDQVYNFLTSCPDSHMRTLGIWWHDERLRVLAEFPKEHHLGNHQWIILNRKHAEMLADDDYWVHLGMKYFACDESYPSTFFSMHGLLHEFRNEFTTFVDWERGRPYVFCEDTAENHQILFDIKDNQNTKGPSLFLFARKISKDFPSDVIRSLVNDKNNIIAKVGDIVPLSITIENTGSEDAINILFQDYLDPCLTLVPNTFKVNDILVPNPNLDVGVPLGTVRVNEILKINFQVMIVSAPISGRISHQYSTTSLDCRSNITKELFQNSNQQNEITIRIFNATTSITPTPTNFEGVIKRSTHLGKKAKYLLKTTWIPSTSPDVVSYKIYKNNNTPDDLLVESIPATGPYIFEIPLHYKMEAKTFTIVAVYANNTESPPIQLKIIKNSRIP